LEYKFQSTKHGKRVIYLSFRNSLPNSHVFKKRNSLPMKKEFLPNKHALILYPNKCKIGIDEFNNKKRFFDWV